MELLFLLSIIFLIAFMVLATYDGVYLHLWKYELFNRQESAFEHKTHTIRAVLFPLIVWALFVETSSFFFWFGIALVVLDLIVLAVDAYSEEESRSFMNGLPRWEYILHLFANSFHFATIVLMIATRLDVGASGLIYSLDFTSSPYFETVQMVGVNVLPGAIALALLHILLSTDVGRTLWNNHRSRITCC